MDDKFILGKELMVILLHFHHEFPPDELDAIARRQLEW